MYSAFSIEFKNIIPVLCNCMKYESSFMTGECWWTDNCLCHVPYLLRFSHNQSYLIFLGCQNTPARGSRFCSEQCATAISFCNDSDESNNIQETHNSDQMGALITRILNEKTTRQGVIYQVFFVYMYSRECPLKDPK